MVNGQVTARKASYFHGDFFPSIRQTVPLANVLPKSEGKSGVLRKMWRRKARGIQGIFVWEIWG